jgi:hypothetical protein
VIKFTSNLDGLIRTSGIVAASDDYTCMLLFSPAGQATATANPKTLFFAWNSADPTQFIRICRTTSGASQTFFRIDVGSTSSTPATVYRANSPHAVWYIRTGTSHALYVEGALLQTITLDISAWTFDEVYIATADSSVTSNPVISVGAFREWDTALTTTQLRAEMNAAAPVVTSGLTCDTPLLADLLDDSGNGSDWTLTNGAGTFALHAILDPAITSQDLVHTIAQHNAIKEIVYAFAATVTGFVGYTLSQSGSDKPWLDINPPGGVPALGAAANLSSRNDSISGWFKVVAGEVYTIRLSNNDTNVSADFTWHLEAAPTLTSPPVNAHIVNDDTRGFPATVHSEAGEFLGFAENIPASEIGAALPGGYTLWHDRFQLHGAGSFLALLDPDVSLVSAFDLPGADTLNASPFYFPRISTANGLFYVLNPRTGAVYTVTTAGVATKIATITGWPASSARVQAAIGVSVDGSILYYTFGEDEGAIKRWDLINDAALSDLYTITGFVVNTDTVAVTANNHPGDIIVQSDGSVVTWWLDLAGAVEFHLLHISAAGALLLDETFPYSTSALNHLAPGDSATQVRIWHWENAGFSQGAMFHGTLSSPVVGPYTLQATKFSTAGGNAASGVLSDLFSPSTSCTFVVLPALPTSTAPTIDLSVPCCIDFSTVPPDLDGCARWGVGGAGSSGSLGYPQAGTWTNTLNATDGAGGASGSSFRAPDPAPDTWGR